MSVTAQENATIMPPRSRRRCRSRPAASGHGGCRRRRGCENVVGAETSAYIVDLTLGESDNLVGAVTVGATDDFGIESLVAAVAASVAFGGEAGVGVAIGVSYAGNVISDGTSAGPAKSRRICRPPRLPEAVCSM